jgi:thiamine biosynthesis lipoprotein
MQRVLEIDDLFSVFKRDSEISKINAAAGDHFVPVRSDTMYVIRQAVSFSALSGGAFDITARPLIELWGIGKKGDAIPKSRDIAAARKLVGYSGILIDEQTCSVKLKHRNQAIDLGGIAKGFAADEVRRILLHHGVSDAILNFGGTVVVIGLHGLSASSIRRSRPARRWDILLIRTIRCDVGSNEQYFIR